MGPRPSQKGEDELNGQSASPPEPEDPEACFLVLAAALPERDLLDPDLDLLVELDRPEPDRLPEEPFLLDFLGEPGSGVDGSSSDWMVGDTTRTRSSSGIDAIGSNRVTYRLMASPTR